MMRQWMGFSLVLLFGVVSCAGARGLSCGESYRGQVRDHDLGKPLAGVLVVFIWYRDIHSKETKQITSEFHAATEVLTDGNGHFEVSAAPETTLKEFVWHIESPGIIFFAPGYQQYRHEVDGVKAFRDPTRIYMRRVKPAKALDLGLHPSFPYHRTPLLLKALNDERARLGLPLIQPSED